MKLIEKKLQSNEIQHFDCYSLKEDLVILPDGEKKTRHYVEHPGGVCILAINKNKKIAFVQQYRYAIGEVTLELPAGKIKDYKKEKPFETAKRELKEETGLQSSNIIPLGCLYPSPGIINEKIDLYFACDLIQGENHLDSDEFINVIWLSMDEIKEKINSGIITDSKTISAIMIAQIKGIIQKNVI